jgi:hypothetical protein
MATAYTSDKKIGGLDPITGTLSAADEIVVNKGGDTLKATVGQIEEAMFAAKTSGSSPQSGDVVVIRRGSLIQQLETQNLIPNGSIAKEKIAAAAGIEDSKLAKITTAGKVGGGAITDGTIAGSTAVNTSGAITTSGALSAGSGTVGGALTVTGVLTANGGVAGSVVGNVTGNASTATKLSSNRTFELTGDVTGTVSSDLTSGASIAASIASNAVTTAKVQDGAITQAKLNSNVILVPTGAVMPFAMNSAPTGWLAAIGTAVSRATYSALFSAIGTTYGVGDGSTTFNLPDLRDNFVRGSGGSLATFGQFQNYAVQSHTHSGTTGTESANHTHTFSGTTGVDYPDHIHYSVLHLGGSGFGVRDGDFDNGPASPTSGASTRHQHNFSGTTSGISANHTHSFTTGNPTGNTATETRPRNIALLYCIKF